MKKFLLVVLVLFLGVVAFLATMALAMFRGWPNWSGFAALALIWGGPIVYGLGRWFFGWLGRRRYAKSLVAKEKGVARDEDYGTFRRQWRHGLMALSPRAFGGSTDPARDLGWFLMLGPPNSGQREALLESGLVNVLRTQGGDREDGKKEKAGCDWYLFDNSVVLDVKGLLPEPEEKGDPAEWTAFLRLLKETGRRQPIEGVVLTVPAELLALDREEALKTLMAQIRERLDEMAQSTDHSAPVYVLLAKLDSIPSLASGLKTLEASGRPTWLLFDAQDPPEAVYARNRLEERFREVFVENLNPDDPLALAPILAVTESLGDLERTISVILAMLSHKSPYAPSPKTRGLFFATRAELEREPDQAPRPLGLVAEPRPGLTKSLGEFFGRILPANRGLTERLNLPGGRRQKVIVASLIAFYALTCLLALGFWLDVRRNRAVSQTIQSARATISQMATPGDHFLWRSDSLDYVLDQLEALREQTLNVRLWPTRADSYAQGLAQDFEKSFEIANERVLADLEEQTRSVKDPGSPAFSQNLTQILWLFEVFSVYDRKGDYQRLSNDFPLMSQGFDGASARDWTLVYNKLLFEYLERSPKSSAPRRFLERARGLVELAMSSVPDDDFNWFIAWASSLPGIKPVTIAGFFENYGTAPPEPDRSDPAGVIEGAYTLEGREAIWRVVEQLKEAYARYRGPLWKDREGLFKTQYDEDYKKKWRDWARRFLSSSAKTPVVAFLNARSLSDSRESPYAKVLELVSHNLKPYLGDDSAQAWLKNIELDGSVFEWTKISESLSAKAKPLEKASFYSMAFQRIKVHMPNYFYRTDFLKRILDAEPFALSYLAQAAKVDDIFQGPPDDAVKLAACHFGGPAYGDPTQSPFTLAESAIDSYAKLLYVSAEGLDDLAVGFRRGILNFQKTRFVAQTAKRIDDLWRSEVVIPVRFLGQDDANKALYGPEGLLIKFQKTTAAPFLDDSGGTREFRAKTWENLTFPFTNDFLRLLTVGDKSFSQDPIKDSYDVVVSAVATLVDAKALEKPQRATLTLKSSDSTQTLDVYNYPISKTFAWKPTTAGETELAIIFPSLELYVNYSGPYAFAGFLRDVLAGEMVFKSSEFPERQEQLEAMGVTEIRVLIKADGALPVIRFLDLSPQPLPASIIKAS